MNSAIRIIGNRLKSFACLGVLLVFIATIPHSILAQQKTYIKGKVVDASTQLPIPYATVVLFKGKNGTITDTAGNFILKNVTAPDSLKASSIGFVPQYFYFQAQDTININFELAPSDYAINEVVILPDERENPAYPIMRQIIAHKPVNDYESVDAYECEVYNKIEIDLDKITEKDKKRMLFKPFKVIFEYVDSSEEVPFLPIFMTESLSDYFYSKENDSRKEHIKATKVSGVKNESVSQLLGNAYQETNIYDNNMVFFNKRFVSPISKSGFRYYRYYLMDSTYINNKKFYKIIYKPKRKQELTFNGEFWVQDSTYAIKELDAHMANDANVNFVTGFHFRLTFTELDSGRWMPAKDELIVEARLFIPTEARNQDFLARKAASYRNYVINKPKENAFYVEPGIVTIAKGVNDKSEEFWKNARHESLSIREENVYAMVDTLKDLPIFRTLRTLVRGYFDVGLWEIGPIFSTYSFNEVEGHRFRVGGRTSNRFSTWTELSGYTAVGTRDEKFKYGLTLRQFVSKSPRQMITLKAKSDVEQLGTSPNLIFRTDNVLNSLFRRNPANRLNRVADYSIKFDREWFKGFTNSIQLNRRELRPLGEFSFNRRNGSGNLESIGSVTATDITLFTHFAWKEEFLSGEFDRISLGTVHPVFDVIYSLGIKDLLGGDYDYHKLVVSMKHRLRLGRPGYINYRLEGGKFWGTLPYPLLEIHQGNETFFYDDLTYNTMNFFEFVSDEYVSASLSWHMEGLFFNKIPLLRKLKLREVASAKAVAGRLSDVNRAELQLPDGMFELREPFAEASIGVENIFRILRFDAVWRLTNLDLPNIVKFGIRMKFEFTF